MQQPASRTPETDEARPVLVVVDDRGDVFVKLRSMELATAIWRTMRAPAGLELPESTVVLFVVYDEPPWDTIRDCARRYPTVVVAANARAEHQLIALRTGAFGYVDITMPADGLRRTLRGALLGEPAFTRSAIGGWMREGRTSGRRGLRGSRPADDFRHHRNG